MKKQVNQVWKGHRDPCRVSKSLVSMPHRTVQETSTREPLNLLLSCPIKFPR